jgi:hypothetical protein
MYGVIVTVAIISAVVPTLIAQAWFKPNLATLAEREQNPSPLAGEDGERQRAG